MIKRNVLSFMLIHLSLIGYAQTLGEAVHKNFNQTKSSIIKLWGSDYFEDIDKSGVPFIAYRRSFNQNGKEVQGVGVFHFTNDRVTQYTTVIDQEHSIFWVREFSRKLIRRDEQYWIEPEYKLVWNLRTNEGRLYITAIDNNALRSMSPGSFGRNWTKEVEAEFMKNCLYGNPSNVGNESKVLPMCSCALETLKEYYSEVKAISVLTSEDIVKLMKGCIK